MDGSPDPARPYEIDDLDVSQVVYGALGTPGRADCFRFAAPPGFVTDLHVVVPDVPACAPFRPTLTMIGPGLDPSAPVPAGVAMSIVDGAGEGVAVAASDEWGMFYEPFTRTTYATGPRVALPLAGGSYLLAVNDPAGEVGTYGLALGGAERFGGDPTFFLKIGAVEQCELPAPSALTGNGEVNVGDEWPDILTAERLRTVRP